MNDSQLSLLRSNLRSIIMKKAEKTVERFEQVVLLGVSNPELASILGQVKSYWKESLRPALTSFSCEAVGGQSDMADDASLLFTLAAAGTQIHDEIIDNSSMNHFRKTVQSVHGKDKALLAGDLLIVKAWSMLGEMNRKGLNTTRIADVIQTYSSLSVQICEAELMDISCRRKLDTNLEYRKSILWNINADMEGCAKVGAILGGGSEEETRTLAFLGRRLGYLLGLRDDIMDSLNKEGILQNRLEFESVPLPLLFASRSSENAHPRIESILKKTCISESDVGELVEFCFETGAFEKVGNIAKYHAKQSFRKLDEIKPCYAKDVLELIIQSFLDDIIKLYS
jgi:geranylgeranyl pyrophosphate synthase